MSAFHDPLAIVPVSNSAAVLPIGLPPLLPSLTVSLRRSEGSELAAVCGAALKLLGDAVEYLSDSSDPLARVDEDAVHLLRRVRRQVFEEYASRSARRRLLAGAARPAFGAA